MGCGGVAWERVTGGVEGGGQAGGGGHRRELRGRWVAGGHGRGLREALAWGEGVGQGLCYSAFFYGNT